MARDAQPMRPTRPLRGPAASSPPDTRLRGRWLLITRMAWVTVTLLTLTLLTVAASAAFEYFQTICRDSAAACDNRGQLTAEGMRLLQEENIPVAFYATYHIVFDVAFAIVCCAIAIVIFWRKSDDRIALFASFMLVTFGGATFGYLPDALAAGRPAWWLLIRCLQFFGGLSFLIFFFTFPDGLFVPHWTRWLIVVWGVWQLPTTFFPGSPFALNSWSELAANLLFVGIVGSALFAQIHRYRCVSNIVQRQQTKWVVFGTVAALGGFLALIALLMTVPALDRPGSLSRLVLDTGFPLLLMLIPLSIGIAMLRSHLWDIDIIINRTLVYAALTSMLALAYGVSVVVFHALFSALTGQQRSELVTVASTLLIAGLFTPLRRRIQSSIDRRFYRRKYDAGQTLAAFSASVRDEVNMNQLTDQLVAVVAETMQPASVSLWLCEPVRQMAATSQTANGGRTASYGC